MTQKKGPFPNLQIPRRSNAEGIYWAGSLPIDGDVAKGEESDVHPPLLLPIDTNGGISPDLGPEIVQRLCQGFSIREQVRRPLQQLGFGK